MTKEEFSKIHLCNTCKYKKIMTFNKYNYYDCSNYSKVKWDCRCITTLGNIYSNDCTYSFVAKKKCNHYEKEELNGNPNLS